MVVPLTAEGFYEGAREFALSALDAHHARKYRRVALDAGTALEHLAKACLASRSPALLTEMKSETNFPSLLRLLGISEGPAPRQLRTVSLRDALARAKTFVTSSASNDDLRTIIDMRDGTVHAAQEEEVEDRLLIAFVQHADALLADLGYERAEFWSGQLAVVDALLADASDRLAHRVAVKLAEARANFQRQYAQMPAEILQIVRQLAKSRTLGSGQELAECPACASSGVAGGNHDVDWRFERGEDGVFHATGTVWFFGDRFACGVCGLTLDSPAELAGANVEADWVVEGADPANYDPLDFYEDAAYEAWREAQHEREEREEEESHAAYEAWLEEQHEQQE